jgi:hypothetical protein
VITEETIKSWFQHYGQETLLIENFKLICDSLKQQELCTMIELGSNVAYYSVLFKQLLGSTKTLNILVEPVKQMFEYSKESFKYHGFNGIFINKGIGNKHITNNLTIDCEITTLDDIINEVDLQTIDILHSDIDGSELVLLKENSQFFINKKAKFIFLSTHGVEVHKKCKYLLESYGYEVLIEEEKNIVGGDSLLILAAKQ